MNRFQKKYSKRYEYISVVPKFIANNKMPTCNVINNKSGISLGYIKYSGAWRQFIFLPNRETQFSIGCLEDVIDYIKSLSKDNINEMRSYLESEIEEIMDEKEDKKEQQK